MIEQTHSKQNCLIVLGMHRSGTSAMARVVNLLGADIGNNLIPSARDNARGFWEHREIVETHEQLFDFLGKPWICFLSPLPDGWWLDDAITPFRQRLVEIVRRDFCLSPIWVLKDPRLCRFIPLWHLIFEELNCAPFFIHIFRNPLEVAASLQERDGLTQTISLLLWLQHVLESEKATRGDIRTFISYDGLLKDWRTAIKKVSMDLKCQWPRDIEEAAADIDLFLSPKLKHHCVSENFAEKDLHGFYWIQLAYSVLLKTSEGDTSELVDSLTNVQMELNQLMQSDFGSMFMEELENQTCRLLKADKEFARIQEQLTQTNRQLARMELRINDLLNSKSWKLTSPFRKIYSIFAERKNK